MKKSILYFLIFLPFFSFSQNSFIINNFDVDILINKNGSFTVTENINLTFTQQQRGIIRQIPYKFSFPENTKNIFESQQNHNISYTIYFENISVDNFKYETSYIGNYLEIKIGSPDVFLTGEQNYKITYTVWGALNQYKNFTEFAWNITGDGWNVPIKEASYSITLPEVAKITTDSIYVVTGTQNTSQQNATKEISGKTISGKTTQELAAFQGLKVYIYLPSDLFDSVITPVEKISPQNYYKNYDMLIKINSDGSADFIEITDFYTTDTVTSLYKYFSTYDVYKPGYRDLLVENYSAEVYNNEKLIQSKVNYLVQDNIKMLSVFTDEKLTGKLKIYYKYKIWGAIDFTDSIPKLDWEIISKGFSIPIEKTTLTITSDNDINLLKPKFSVYKNDFIAQNVTALFETKNKISVSQNFSDINDQNLKIILFFNPDDFAQQKVPAEVYAKDYYVENFNTVIDVLENGAVKVKHTFEVHFKENVTDYYGKFSFDVKIQEKYRKSFSPGNGEFEIIYPRWRILGIYLYPIISDIYSSDPSFHKESWSNKYIWETENADSSSIVTFDYEYEIFSLLKKSGDNYIFNFPVIPALKEPIINGTLTLNLPDNVDEGFAGFEGFILDENNNKKEFLMIAKGSTLTGEFTNLTANDVPVFKIEFSKKYISKPSVFKKIRLLLKNNNSVIILFIIFAILYLIWNYFGKDKVSVITEKETPPLGVTPAEAGFLWDNKLHFKDIISLIIYWASLGYIEIIEEEKGKDYLFIRRNPMPKEAFNYEKILYNGIFPKDVNQVRLSSLRTKMYYTMKQTEKDFNWSFNTKATYMPGTRGFSKLLVVLSIVAATISGFAFLINAHQKDYQTGIIFLVIAVMFFVFGRIMPKFGNLGRQKYEELLGLKKFIESATLSKIEELQTKDPDYFGKILPFAIVMGLHHSWANQFVPITIEQPKWFKSSQEGTFTPSAFIDSIIKMMNKANLIFRIRPANTSYSGSGTYRKSGGGFKSSSSSSSSKSSYSSSSKSSSSKSSTTRSSTSRPPNKGGGGKSW